MGVDVTSIAYPNTTVVNYADYSYNQIKNDTDVNFIYPFTYFVQEGDDSQKLLSGNLAVKAFNYSIEVFIQK